MSAIPLIILTFPVSAEKLEIVTDFFLQDASALGEVEFHTDEAPPSPKKSSRPRTVHSMVEHPRILDAKLLSTQSAQYQVTVSFPILVQPAGADSLRYEMRSGEKICRLYPVSRILDLGIDKLAGKSPWYRFSRPTAVCKLCGIPAGRVVSLHFFSELHGLFQNSLFQVISSKLGQHGEFVCEVKVPINRRTHYAFHQLLFGVLQLGSKHRGEHAVPYEMVRGGRDWLQNPKPLNQFTKP